MGKEKGRSLVSRQLSQQEIDAVFQNLQRAGETTAAPKAVPFDFRRLDRIPKSQLRAIRLLHDNFVRNLGSSLSAYLRADLTLNLVSVEQLAYGEFLEGLASPTCLVLLGLRPYEGNALLEMNPAVVFSILEILLGGKGKNTSKIEREITDIEQSLLDGFLRILLNDLKEAWENVTSIDFSVESLETEPQFVQILDPGEAFVAVAMEMRAGETTGMVNLAFPSLFIKMMRNRFDHQLSLRKAGSTEADQARMLRLVEPAEIELEARLQGPTLRLEDLVRLQEGEVLPFDHPVGRPIDLLVNGRRKYQGRVVSQAANCGFLVETLKDDSC
jgi:flagellar motor switch protein FliM